MLTSLRASDRWLSHFMKRHSLLLHCKTSMVQEVPATLEERITAFYKHFKRVKELYSFRVVGNMNETPLFFDVVLNRVIATKGTMSIVVTLLK